MPPPDVNPPPAHNWSLGGEERAGGWHCLLPGTSDLIGSWNYLAYASFLWLLITLKGFMIYLLKVSLQDISELKSERLALRKRMEGQTLHLRKFSGSRANFQAFVEETIREGGQEIQDFHNLARGVSLITFETRRTALEALLLLQTQLDTQASPFRFD